MVLGNRNYGFGKSIKFHGEKISKLSWETYLSHEIKSIYFHNLNPTSILISVYFHIGITPYVEVIFECIVLYMHPRLTSSFVSGIIVSFTFGCHNFHFALF